VRNNFQSNLNLPILKHWKLRRWEFIENWDLRIGVSLFVLYTLLAIIITYPLIFNLSHSVYSIPERMIDGLADIYDLWWWREAFLSGGDPNFIPQLGLGGGKIGASGALQPISY
jgi:hypothetical protein